MRAARDHRAVQARLFERLARGQLLLLVGAGASRWAGLPSWREAVCALAEDLPAALRERVPHARARFAVPSAREPVPVEALLRILEAHRRLCGEARLVARLAALFDTSRIDPADLPLQQLLVRLSRFVPAMRWIWAKLGDLEVPPIGWFVEVGSSTDLERITMELDRIVRVDLEADEPDHPPELLDFLGGLVERCERELGGGEPLRHGGNGAPAPA